jgi:hypothetical protein
MKFHFQRRIGRTCFLLAAILILGAALRFNHITQPFNGMFRWRQTSTAMMASNFYHRSWNIFYPQVSWTGTDPGYQGREFQTITYIAALLYLIFGEHDWIGRSVAVCFGLWGIFALYHLIRRIWGEERALWGAAVMSLLPGSICIERCFLPDPAMVALMTTSVWMLVCFLQTDRLMFLVLAGVTGCWGVLTKLPGLVVGPAMLYAILVVWAGDKRRMAKRLVAIGVTALLALVPVAAYYLWALHLSRAYPPYHLAGQGNWIWTHNLSEWLNAGYFVSEIRPKFEIWLWTRPVIVLVAIGTLLPLLSLGRHKLNWNAASHQSPAMTTPYLFHFWVLGVLVYYAIGAQEMAWNTWNFHILNPAAAALAGGALSTAAAFIAKLVAPSRQVLIKIGLCVLYAVIMFKPTARAMAVSYAVSERQGYELGLALREVSAPADLVLTMPRDLGDPMVIYYSQRRGWPFPPPGIQSFPLLPENDRESIDAFEQLRCDGARWLGIVATQLQRLERSHPILLRYFDETCLVYRSSPNWTIYSIPPPQRRSD